MNLSGAAATLIAFGMLPYFYSLLTNYQKARGSGLPVLICPINPTNPVWLIISSLSGTWMRKNLPYWLWDRVRYAIYGWIYFDQLHHVDLPAPVFMMVTPGKNYLWIADPDVADGVLTRRKDFVVPDVARVYFGQFGPNVLTANGADWSKYRKLFSQALNDRIHQRVWEAASEQAEMMLQWSLEQPGRVLHNFFEAAKTIAINVTLTVDFDAPNAWKPSSKVSSDRVGASGLAWALEKVARRWVVVMTMPRRLLTSRVMPKVLQELGDAANTLPSHFQEAVLKEKKAQQSESSQRNSFLGLLLHHSDPDRKAANYITSAELQGNLLAFTLGSFETSSATMNYAITLLAAHPQWQDWIGVEIDAVLDSQSPSISVSEVMTRLTRCQALLDETLRLFTPVLNTARAAESTQLLSVNGETHPIPHDTQIAIPVGLMHTDPVWGSDRLEFKPARFLDDNVPKTYFMPFSRGARICPGARMAQIEILAVLTRLFSRARVQPATKAGETIEEARKRLKTTIKDSQPQIALQMARPQDVELVWRLKNELGS